MIRETRELCTPSLETLSGYDRWSLDALLFLLGFIGPIDSFLDFGYNSSVLPRYLASQSIVSCGVVNVLPVEHYSPSLTVVQRELSGPIRLGRKFSLVSSLEVAEHLPPESADIFVESIVAHCSRWCWFAAAVPGQDRGHVNEQEPEYWIEKFIAKGMKYLAANTVLFREALLEIIGPCWFLQSSLLFKV